MLKLGIFVGEDNWTFFNEIYADLSTHYETRVFKRKIYNTPILYGRLNRWKFSSDIQRLLADTDVCFFEWASDLLAVASYMPKKSKIVARLHSFELFDWAPKINWDTVDKIIFVSNAMKQMFSDIYPNHAPKAEVIFNGRPLDHFYPPEKRAAPIKIGMLGHISPIKRVYETVLTFFSIVKQGYDSRFHIAGEPFGDYRYYVAVHRLVEKLGMQDRVIFDGYRKDANVWLRNIDIFISNSYWEGQQVALLEAMASGCYCLSHVWAGADEMLPGHYLFLTEKELADKVIEYIKMPERERLQHQTTLRKLALEKFDIEKTKMKIRHIVEELGDKTSYNISA